MDWKKRVHNILSRPPLENEPMSLHTSLRIGGPAELLIYPQSLEELKDVFRTARLDDIPIFVLGQGTNLLVRDEGIRGIVVNLSYVCSDCRFMNDTVRAGAALPLSKLAREAADKGLDGLVFTTGIPGSLGGALYMNAGAYGSTISELVSEVGVLDYDGRYQLRSREELDFSYRWSNFQSEDVVIIDGVLDLQPGDKEEIITRMRAIQDERRFKHPLLPSAGSVFRNPPGRPAGKLIEEAGCKGMLAGGAEVSLQHGNFIVNKGNATADDFLTLVDLIREKVKNIFGVELELEIRIIGGNGSEQGRR
ncbi:MAG: UDP-N-acetylmuramate dehydrogenase [Bacillota bacterium]|nr:UDP-N-acetylmuramate dehydrogenase [Bacillota bacterium]